MKINASQADFAEKARHRRPENNLQAARFRDFAADTLYHPTVRQFVSSVGIVLVLVSAILLFVANQEAEPARDPDRIRMDGELLASLRKSGADFSKPHRMEHHFICRAREGCESLRGALVPDKGYEFSEIVESDGEWSFDAVRTAPIPSLDDISAETTRLDRIATEIGCTYDGWGTEVQS